MRTNIKKYGFIYLIGIVFIFCGLYYNVAYISEVLTDVGGLPVKFSLFIWFIDFMLIILGTCIMYSRKTIYRFRKELLLLTATLIVMFLFLEFAFRIYLTQVSPQEQSLYLDKDSIRQDQIFSKHHYLTYYPTPNYRSLDGLNIHNSLGYRGEEIAETKSSGTYRIVALGGSSTYGTGVKSYKDSYPYKLEEKLIASGYDVEVINAGVGGYSSYESLINFQFRVLDLEPDLVIFYHGTNDVHNMLVNPNYYKGDNSGRRKSWTEQRVPFFFKSAIVRYAVTKVSGYALTPAIGMYVTADTVTPGLKETGYNKILDGEPLEILQQNEPVYFKRNIENVIAVAKAHDVEVMLATWSFNDQFDDYAASPHYVYGFEQINQVIAQSAQKHNVYMLDFAAEMSYDDIYWSDGRHLTKEGNELKSEIFAGFIQDIIK